MIIIRPSRTLRGFVDKSVSASHLQKQAEAVVCARALRKTQSSLVKIIAAVIDECRHGFVPGRSLRDCMPRRVEIVAAHLLEKSDGLVCCESLVIMRPNVCIVFLASIAQHPNAEIVTAALRKVPGFISIDSGTVIKDGGTAGLHVSEADTEGLGPAVEDSSVTVYRRALSFGVIPVVTLTVQKPARASGQSNRLREQPRLVNVIALIVHMNGNTPRSHTLSIFVGAIGIVARFIQEQCRTQNRRSLSPLQANIFIVALPVD